MPQATVAIPLSFTVYKANHCLLSVQDVPIMLDRSLLTVANVTS
jgi:hypothetical protein